MQTEVGMHGGREDILTGPEVAAYLRIGKVKAYEMMRNGEIPSFRVGIRGIRTTREAVMNYILEMSQNKEGWETDE